MTTTASSASNLAGLEISAEYAEVFATIHQPDHRRVGTPPYFQIGISLLKQTDTGDYEYIDGTPDFKYRQHQLEINPGRLPPGKYLLLPTSSHTVAAGEEPRRQAALSIHCE